MTRRWARDALPDRDLCRGCVGHDVHDDVGPRTRFALDVELAGRLPLGGAPSPHRAVKHPGPLAIVCKMLDTGVLRSVFRRDDRKLSGSIQKGSFDAREALAEVLRHPPDRKALIEHGRFEQTNTRAQILQTFGNRRRGIPDRRDNPNPGYHNIRHFRRFRRCAAPFGPRPAKSAPWEVTHR